MRRWKKLTACAMSVFLAGTAVFPVLAKEERTKIEDVSLSFSYYGDEDDTEYGEIEVTADSGPYGVENVEFLSTTSTSSKYPRVKVTLYADNDYYFGSSGKNFFELDGEGAVYKSASLKNSKEMLVLTAELRQYSGAETEDVEDVEWNYEGGGTWGEVPNTVYYEVRLKKGGIVIGSEFKVEDTFADFSSMITQTGNYSFQVRAVNRYITSNKSKWASSERWTIDAETLQEIRRSSGNLIDDYYHINTADQVSNYNNNTFTNSAAANVINPPSLGSAGWRKDNIGYWYQNENGSYPASCWQYIDEYWHYFNPSGYMVVSSWQFDNGCWYYFNVLGQRVDNQWIRTSDGKYYYVGADGKMLTNTRTPDGYFVDSTGAWQPGM